MGNLSMLSTKPFYLLTLQEVKDLMANGAAPDFPNRWKQARMIFDAIADRDFVFVGLLQEEIECHPDFPGRWCWPDLIREILRYSGFEGTAPPYVTARAESWRRRHSDETEEVDF